MVKVNENFLKLQAGYLFPELNRRITAFKSRNPDAKIINLGIGDVTQPIAPAIIEAMNKAVGDLSRQETFHGYGPEGGYDFLIRPIIANDYKPRGINLKSHEIFVSDGAKCDTGNIQEIFSTDSVAAVADPVYPVYIDSNVMAGRTGPADENGRYANIVYLPCTEKNGFIPEPPAGSNNAIDLIYLCLPNNPTGAVAGKDQLRKWVDFAREKKAIILFDAAYEAFITEPDIPHSIYEIDGAKDVAIEFRSFSKTAGFTGVRCAFTVVPEQLRAYTENGNTVRLNKLWNRRHCTKFNGASYISQVAAAAAYTDEGKAQLGRIIDIYMQNAALIRNSLTRLGYTVYGGVNAPYIWMKTPDGLSSWDFFNKLLHKAHLVGTPGVGFGPAGQGYFRITAFGKPDDIEEAVRRFNAV